MHFLCSMITAWMDTGMVQVEDFPVKYSGAIYSQYAIGWDIFFCGEISQHWLSLFNESQKKDDSEQQLSAPYIWGANIVEITLRNMIGLWEIRNEQVHGGTHNERQ